MLQFSLRNLLVAVTVFAVGTAALINANAWWSSLMWAAALSMLALAGFVAFLRRDSQRAFWSGYVVAGSLYLLLLMYSVPNQSASNTWMPYGPLNYNNLLSTKLILGVYSSLPTSKTTPFLPAPTMAGGMSGAPGMGSSMAGAMGGGMAVTGMGPPTMMPNPDYIDQEAFTEIGQAIWLLFLSWLGGTVAFGLFRTRNKPNHSGASNCPANT